METVVFFLLLKTMTEIRGESILIKKLFLIVETNFNFLPEETAFPYGGNVFFNECFVPGSGNRFSG